MHKSTHLATSKWKHIHGCKFHSCSFTPLPQYQHHFWIPPIPSDSNHQLLLIPIVTSNRVTSLVRSRLRKQGKAMKKPLPGGACVLGQVAELLLTSPKSLVWLRHSNPPRSVVCRVWSQLMKLCTADRGVLCHSGLGKFNDIYKMSKWW